MTDQTCNRKGCGQPADGVLALELYPHRSVMKHYRCTNPLTRIIIGLVLCNAHKDEAIADGAPAFIPADALEGMIQTCEEASGTAIDRAGHRTVLLPLDHIDVLKLAKIREVQAEMDAAPPASA